MALESVKAGKRICYKVQLGGEDYVRLIWDDDALALTWLCTMIYAGKV